MATKIKCPICQSKADKSNKQIKDSYDINCERCGTYEIDGLEFITLFNNDELNIYLSKISDWIIEQNKIYKTDYPLLSREIIYSKILDDN